MKRMWDPEPSAGVYSPYRDLTGELVGLQFGVCEQQALPEATTTDTDPPPPGETYRRFKMVLTMIRW